MKKTLLWHLCAVMAAIFLAGCSSSNDPNPGPEPPGPTPPPTPTLEVTPSTGLDFKADGQPQTLTIKANGAWTISSDKTWCKLSPANGSGDATVTVSVDVSQEMDVRNAVITAQRETLSKTVAIRQLGEAPAILLASENPFVVAAGGDVGLKVTTNIDYEISTPDWLQEVTPAATSKVMVTYDHIFAASEYTGVEAPRFGNIVVKQKGSDLMSELMVTQLTKTPADVVDLYLKEPNTIPSAAVSSGGGVVAVNPQGVVEKIEATESWIDIVPDGPAAQSIRTKSAPNPIAFVVTENAGATRTGFVYISVVGGKKDTVIFRQIGVEATVMPGIDEATVSQAAGVLKFNVLFGKNAEYDVTIKEPWLSVAPQSASNKTSTDMVRISMSFAYDENINIEQRENLITFKPKNSSSESTVKVIQKGYGSKSMYLEKKAVTLNGQDNLIEPVIIFKAGQKAYDYDITVDWITKDNAEPNRDIFAVAANPDAQKRVGKIIFTQKDSKSCDTLVVTQMGYTSDKFNRSTDSMAIRDLLGALAMLSPNYAWPDGANLTQLRYGPVNISTKEINGEQRVHFINIAQVWPTYVNSVEIPDSFWNLSQLVITDIRAQLRGAISTKINNMKNLEVLRFSNGFVGGALPKEIGELPVLNNIYIANDIYSGDFNPVTSIPDEISKLSSLKSIVMDISFPKIPDAVCNIPNLENLNLQKVSGTMASDFIPASISNLKNLIYLSVIDYDGNGCVVPPSIFNIPSLKSLNITTNAPIPALITNSNLDFLGVQGDFSSLLESGGRVPQTLTGLSIESPNFDALTDEMLSSNLNYVAVFSDKLSNISSLLGRLTKVTDVIWGGFSKEVNIPNDIFNITSIKSLNFQKVKGQLPDDLMKLRNLRVLQINNSSVEGVISDRMWEFFLNTVGRPTPGEPEFYRLMLKMNKFTGSIPPFVLESNNWQEDLLPSQGGWRPKQAIIPQQQGYGFDNIKMGSYPKSDASPKHRPDSRGENMRMQLQKMQ